MEKFDCMMEANKIAHEVLQKCKNLVITRETITKEEIAIFVDCQMTMKNVQPAFKGIHGFPYSICISINDEAIHGIAEGRTIVKGDLVSLDFGVIYEGYCSDAAISFVNDVVISNPITKKRRLVRKTKQALEEAVKELQRTFPNCKVSDISKTIQKYGVNYGIITAYGGHGIGKKVHESRIFVPNTTENMEEDLELSIGDYFTIEPMFTLGSGTVIDSSDGFTIKTLDGSLAAHFEYSLTITKEGVVVLK